MECWNCKQLTAAFLAVNPERKGFAKCEECIKEMQENGYVFIDLPYQPDRSKREDPKYWIHGCLCKNCLFPGVVGKYCAFCDQYNEKTDEHTKLEMRGSEHCGNTV